MNKDYLKAQAIDIVKREKTEWEDAPAYVTEQVFFNMREVIRQCRKNYWGVFDEPTDKVSGREKIWHHLTKSFVDYKVKNRDLDTKDINFRAKHPSAIPESMIIRSIVKNSLDEIFFGETLDITQRQLEIDGTAVWMTEEDEFKPRLIDLLNIYIDPVTECISEADSIIERLVLPITTFKKIGRANKWLDLDIQGTDMVSRTDERVLPATRTSVKYVEVYRRRGLAPKWLITGKEKDDEDIPTEIIVSGTKGNWTVHNIEQRKDNALKGYEEAWSTRVQGRWYGEGTAERLLQYQLLENENLNIRRERGMVSKLGVFQVKKGAGITPQALSRLTVNGAVEVQNPGQDLIQMPIADVPISAYKDEELIYQLAQRVTGMFETAVGEALPSSTPATNAAIQAQGAKTQTSLDQEGFGMFLQRWLKRYAVPNIIKKTKVGDLVRMEFDPKDLRAFDEGLVSTQMASQLEQMNAAMQFVDPNQVQLENNRALESIQRQGQDRFVQLDSIPDLLKYDVEVYITNEEIDKGVAIQNIVSMMPIVPEYKDQLIQQAFDLMGLNLYRPTQIAPQPGLQGMQGAQGASAAQVPSQNPTVPVTNALTYG